MLQDKTGNRELVWLLRLRQGCLFEPETLSVEFLGTYEGIWDRDAVRSSDALPLDAVELASAINGTAPEGTSPVT